MISTKHLILGGGMVAGYAAKEMAARGLKPDELTIVSADDALPYERPPLSKGFLSGKETREKITINDPAFYRQHGIRVKLDTAIEKVDLKKKRLRARGGEEFAFENLVLATGARARLLDVPGSHLRGVFHLRSLNDSRQIRSAAESARRAAVIGGGFIGMEVASVLAQKKIETLMILREDRVWKQFFTPEMSSFFESYYAMRGVRILKQATLRSLEGDQGVTAAILADGQRIPCDLVVAGIGAVPATEILSDAGLQIDNGVVVNEYLQARDPDVYAAGDVANYPDALFGKRRRVEHWDNAVSQGEHCARALLGDRKPFVHVPYFFSDVFDLSYELWGDPSEGSESVFRGERNSNSFSVWWLKRNRVVAAFAMNRPDQERETAPKWIESRQVVAAQRLGDASRSLADAATEA